MITFIYGPHGSGKTHYIFERLKENAKDTLLIVPEQQTVSAERLALNKLPPSAGIEFEVLNFTRLCNRVFRIYGGLSYHYITPSMKSLFMWRTLRELSPLLKKYSKAALDLSFTDKMLKTLEEMKACAVTSKMLDDVNLELEEGNLKAKLCDIALICEAYSARVYESFDDKAEDLLKLASLVEKNRFFEGKRVFIDSFTSFTAQEHKIIELIFKQAKDVTIAFSCDSPNLPLISNESVCKTAKSLIRSAKESSKKTEEIYLTEIFRAKNRELELLCSDFWKSERKTDASKEIKKDERGNVNVYCSSNPYDEADAVVAIINKEIRRGLRYKDIAVIARDTSQYEGIIDAALESAGIPHYMSKKNSVSSSPAVTFLLSAIRIKYLNYRAEDVLSHIKTGLCGISLKDADMFENYVNTWSISGNRFKDGEWKMNPDGYSASAPSKRGEKILAAANAVREKLCDELSPFFDALNESKNARDMAAAIYSYLVASNVNEALRKAAEEKKNDKNDRAASDCIAIWNIIIGILDDINTAIGDESLDTEQLYRALLLCFEKNEVGSIPTGFDEVTVGSASLLRADNVKCAIIIGANEGEFPAAVTESGIFSDSDRSVLNEKSINLSNNAEERSSEELLFASRAMAIPSEKLYMLYCKTSANGSPLRPSLLVNRLVSYFNYLDNKTQLSAKDMVFSVDSAIEKLPFISDKAFKRAISDELQERDVKYEGKPFSSPDCSVSPETAAAVFGNKINLTQSRIDKFSDCHFAYYCNYILGLRTEEKANIDSRVSGTFIHSVLEKILQRSVTENGLDMEKAESSLDSVIQEIIDSLCTEEQKASNRLSHLFLRLRRISLLLLSSIQKELDASVFVPAFYELKIGDNGIEPLTLTLNDGTKVNLYGTVDRVDIWKNEEDVYIRVVDYKTGSNKFSLSDIKEGLNLQLLIYLFTLCHPNTKFAKSIGCADGKAPIPAGANYLSSNVSNEKYSFLPSRATVLEDAEDNIIRSGFSLNAEALENDFGSKEKAILSLDEIYALKDELEITIANIAELMRSGDASASPQESKSKSPCEYCKMASICRASTVSN